MRQRLLPLENSEAAQLTSAEVKAHGKNWIIECEYRQCTKATVANYKNLLKQLEWFMAHEEREFLDIQTVKAFLAYLRRGHEEPGGRWGNPKLTRPIKPSTAETYFIKLHSFLSYLVNEEVLEKHPMEKMKAPVVREDQIQPLSSDQLGVLLETARKSKYGPRDYALLVFLYDTGCRANEACKLKFRDVDFGEMKAVVQGKGSKDRVLPFSMFCRKALWDYTKYRPRKEDEPLFFSERGDGFHMTRQGLTTLVKRLGKASGIKGVRISPHTLRHTFAINYLRLGGDAFSLKEILGHTSLAMTNKYVALAQADIQAKHRQFSPADRLKRKR